MAGPPISLLPMDTPKSGAGGPLVSFPATASQESRTPPTGPISNVLKTPSQIHETDSVIAYHHCQNTRIARPRSRPRLLQRDRSVIPSHHTPKRWAGGHSSTNRRTTDGGVELCSQRPALSHTPTVQRSHRSQLQSQWISTLRRLWPHQFHCLSIQSKMATASAGFQGPSVPLANGACGDHGL
jgi:hypothetical protein